ncbi:dynamin family protein [Paenibacillus sp. FSL H8-0034]|uniref:dynamin family protein n=1 Tax=Paenibacillus sp. FSL H8-0034 TaxID=2954671 RepID=UPI0030F999A1
MSNAFALYERKKQHVLTQLMQLKELAHELKNPQLTGDVEDQYMLLQREQFEIMVIGEFNNGKSTFVNALLGKHVLPSAVRPTTAILNKIHFHPVPRYRLHYRDAKKPPQSVTGEEFLNLVAPEELMNSEHVPREVWEKNVSLIQNIDYAEIGQPVELCKHDVVIIDSPGTNDLDPGREAITNYYIPKCDAAVIVFNVQHALSESEMSFIKHRILSADIQKLFFVLNFKDLLVESELQKVSSYVEQKLSSVVADPKIFIISSRHALLNRAPQPEQGTARRRRPTLPIEETGILEFEQALMDFLEFERGSIKLEKPIRRGVNLAEGMLERYVSFERSTLNNNIKDMKEKIQGLSHDLEQVRLKGKESVGKFDLRLQQQGGELRKWYEKQLRDIASKAQNAVEANYYKGCDVNRVKRIVEDQIAPIETELGQELLKRAEGIITEGIEMESKPLVEGLQDIHKQWTTPDFGNLLLNPFMSKMMMANFIETIFKAGVIGILIAKFAIIGIIFGGAILLFKNVFTSIGDFFAGRDSKKEQLKEEIKERFEAPISERVSKLRVHWNDVIPVVKEKYAEQVQWTINDTAAQMNIMIQNNQLNETEIADSLKKLEVRERRLLSIIQELLNNQLKPAGGNGA